MIDLLSFLLGLAAAGIPLFPALIWYCDKAWWLGIWDYRHRYYSACDHPCEKCDVWRRCLHHEKPVDPDELQHKDETNESWVRAWKREVGKSD